MRKNFAQILSEAKVDIKKEYYKLYQLFYCEELNSQTERYESVYNLLEHYFTNFYFRGTCLSLQEFDELNGFSFEKEPQDFSIEILVSLMEYIYNLSIAYQSMQFNMQWGYMNNFNLSFLLDQVRRVCESISYMETKDSGFAVFVEKSPTAIAVAESELIPKDFSYKVISYNHHSMKGNLNAKKETLLALANILEGKRKALKKANSALEDDLFFIFNKFNLRHNNCDPGTKKYISVIAEMDKQSLEEWYDETYQMCLLAFMEIEHAERKIKFNSIKKEIEEKKPDF